MKTRIFNPDDEKDLQAAADILINGGLLAFPTETVYGLGARADRAEAVEKLLKVKGRPAHKKMAVLVSGIGDVERYVAPIPEKVRQIAETFWPGPVTIVVEAAGGDTVGLRCPDLGFMRKLVSLVGAPVFAPSANPTGKEPALNAREVLGYFGGRIDAVLDGGAAAAGKPSTVVRVRDNEIEILREGAMPAEEIKRLRD